MILTSNEAFIKLTHVYFGVYYGACNIHTYYILHQSQLLYCLFNIQLKSVKHIMRTQNDHNRHRRDTNEYIDSRKAKEGMYL